MQNTRRTFTRTALLAAAGGMLLPPSLWAQAITYKVRKGDTLGKIALSLNTSTRELKRANNLSSDLIQVGQKLTIPAGNNSNIADVNPIAMKTYIVAKGDTLGKIAQRHAISISELKAANNLSCDLILVGQNLRIPECGQTSCHDKRPNGKGSLRDSTHQDTARQMAAHRRPP